MFKGDANTIPASFSWQDSANAGGQCVGAVRSQLTCGSCWAFSATSALADRACVKNNANKGAVLAAEQLVLCDNLEGCSGCDGGTLEGAWDFFASNGVTNDVCIP